MDEQYIFFIRHPTPRACVCGNYDFRIKTLHFALPSRSLLIRASRGRGLLSPHREHGVLRAAFEKIKKRVLVFCWAVSGYL